MLFKTPKDAFNTHIEMSLRLVEFALRLGTPAEIRLSLDHRSKLIEAFLNLSEIHNERTKEAMDELERVSQVPTPRESYMASLNKATWSIAEAFEHLKEPDATTVSEAEMKLVKNILSGLELLTREG